MNEPHEVRLARLDEKVKGHDKKITDLEREVYEKHEERMKKMEQVTARNAVIVSYVERLGWAIIVALVSSFHWVKNIFTGEG